MKFFGGCLVQDAVGWSKWIRHWPHRYSQDRSIGGRCLGPVWPYEPVGIAGIAWDCCNVKNSGVCLIFILYIFPFEHCIVLQIVHTYDQMFLFNPDSVQMSYHFWDMDNEKGAGEFVTIKLHKVQIQIRITESKITNSFNSIGYSTYIINKVSQIITQQFKIVFIQYMFIATYCVVLCPRTVRSLYILLQICIDRSRISFDVLWWCFQIVYLVPKTVKGLSTNSVWMLSTVNQTIIQFH